MNEHKPIILFESYPDFSGSALEIYNELIKRGYEEKYNLVWAVDKDFNANVTQYNTIKFFNTSNENQKSILKNTKIIIDINRYVNKLNCNYRLYVRHGRYF